MSMSLEVIVVIWPDGTETRDVLPFSVRPQRLWQMGTLDVSDMMSEGVSQSRIITVPILRLRV